MTRKRESAPVRGYTLVELLAVLCIAGIVLTLAIPSFDMLARNERRTAVVFDLLATLRVARSEALKRGGRPVVICGVADADGDGTLEAAEQVCAGHDWSAGWVLGTWQDADGDARVDPAELQVLRAFATSTAGRLTVTAGHFMATPPVAPAGTLIVKASGKRSSNGTITVCDDRGPAAARAVIMSSLARARVSAKKADGSALPCP